MRLLVKINRRDLVREGGSENSRSLASKWFEGDEEEPAIKHSDRGWKKRVVVVSPKYR